MTYNTVTRQLSKACFIEFSMPSTQTISNGSIIKFDASSKRTTGSDSVSYNSTTGVLTLSPNKRYWVQGTVNVNRSSNSYYRIDWVTSSSTTALTPANGGFSSLIQRGGGNTKSSSSHVVSLMVDYPTLEYRLRVGVVPSNSTVTTLSNLFIIEAE